MSDTELSDDFFRRESARLVGMLTAQFGVHRLEFAEDVAQETLVRALQSWPYRGMPDSPAAWLTRAAKNLATDHLRREQRWIRKESAIADEHGRWLAEAAPEAADEAVPDDTLRMLFVCFHPQLSADAQKALALRTLCGFSPAEIAAAFLTTEAAVQKRLVRARQRIRELAVPFVVPGPADLQGRLDGVLGTLYLLFNEGYKASSGDRLVRADLCRESIRLVGLLTRNPETALPRTFALLALMLLNAARLPSRSDDAGNLLRLHEQDRSAWDRQMIGDGIRFLALSGRGGEVSAYHLEAGIAACHSTAADSDSTDWPRVLALYDQLLAVTASPVVALNRAVALARVNGVDAGIEALRHLPLDHYYLLHAIRGTFERDRGRTDRARQHFARAEELATLPSERAFLRRRLQECQANP